MEDYELVQLLRQRSRITSQLAAGQYSASIKSSNTSLLPSEERIQFLRQQAFCSPRRWQALGVIHVTATNSRIVHLYNTAVNNDSETRNGGSDKKLLADEQLFCHYYNTNLKKKKLSNVFF